MEGVWPKTEPTDDSFDECLSIKLEQEIAEPLIIIEQDESKIVSIKSNDVLEEIDPIQKLDVKKGVQKSRKISPRKPKPDAGTLENESGDKEVKQRRKASTRVKKAYICDECGREFGGSYNLNRHKLIHAGLRPYVCPEDNCGAAFRESATLKSHQMLHTGDRKFFCEECGQGFLSKFQLRIHQRSKHSGERPFVCGECGQGFVRKDALTRHELEHSGEKRFECEDCGMKFYEKILLRSHKQTHSTDGRPFTCTECGKGFYHKTSLNAHQRNHATVRPFACEICGKRFTQKGTLTVHKVVHGDVIPFECEVCGLRFTQKFTLKTHRMKQHGLSLASEKQQRPVQTGLSVSVVEPRTVSHHSDNIQQSETSESSTTVSAGKPIVTLNKNSKSSLEAQQSAKTSQIVERISPTSQSESSSSEKTFVLDTNSDACIGLEDKFAVNQSIVERPSQTIDGMSMNLDQIKEEPLTSESYADIWKSERTTPDDESKKPTKKPYSCGICEKRFVLVGALKNHRRTHIHDNKETQNVSFVCDECGKVFAGRAGKQHLKIHKRIHSGSTPYSCAECGKSFTQLGNLKSHQLVHTGERQFGCEICGKRFSMKNTLDKHKRTHTDSRDFECDVCGKKFKYSGSIKRHKMRHTGEKNFGCDICGKTFIEKSYIKFHLRTHTGYKPFACDECPSTFTEKSQLTQHKGYSHRTVGEPSPYKRRKLQKMMEMMNNSM